MKYRTTSVALKLEPTNTHAHLRLVPQLDLASSSSQRVSASIELPNPRGLLLVDCADTEERRQLYARMQARQLARMAKQRMRTNIVSIAFVGIALLAFVIVMYLSVGAQHAQVTEVKQTVNVERIHVQSGDSLWSIAQAHPISGITTQETVSYIMDINELNTYQLAPGQTLEVPLSN